MVDFRPSDAAPPLSSAAAPAAKRKRLASCLGEQERRDRKRAIDREAQRSLREKTKAHIADLERTIEILRQQDSNGATASLLSEIDQLRAENVRLKEIIDSVKTLVGGPSPVASRTTTSANASNGHGDSASSAANSITGEHFSTQLPATNVAQLTLHGRTTIAQAFSSKSPKRIIDMHRRSNDFRRAVYNAKMP
ncbi:BRLZ domain containing protein [Pyrenophora teres f. maculata]|nr:BRLZ domain containing protein [Pyrenophora teres f. maculata]